MENKKFQELVLSQLTKLSEGMSGLAEEVSDLKQDVSELKNKLDLVYDHVAKITETQTDNSKRITKVEKDTTILAELYGKHEVEIKNIKSVIL